MPRHEDARGCTVEDTCEVKFGTCHINGCVTSDGGFKMHVLPHMQSSAHLHPLSKLLQLTRIPSPAIIIFSTSAYPNPQTINLISRPSPYPGQARSKAKAQDISRAKVMPKTILVLKRDFTMSLLTET